MTFEFLENSFSPGKKRVILVLMIFIGILRICRGCVTTSEISEADTTEQKEKGLVRYINKECNCVLIVFDKGKYYVLGEDLYNQSDTGDWIYGNFNTSGEQLIYNETKSKEYQLYIGSRFSDRETVFRMIEDKCGIKFPPKARF